MNKITLSKEDILRNEIITAAQELFQHYGLKKTTMENIAKAMGKGKSTLYYYFKNKEEIFDAVLRTEMNDVYYATLSAVELTKTFSDKLRVFFSTSIEVAKTKAILYDVVKQEVALQDITSTHHIAKELNKKSVALVKDILVAGCLSGEFKTEFWEEADFIAYTMVSAMKGVIIDMATDAPIPDWDKRLKLLLDFLIKSLSK